MFVDNKRTRSEAMAAARDELSAECELLLSHQFEADEVLISL